MKYKTQRKVPEAQVQAEFYSACKEADIKCCLEYRHQDCQFDAVIVQRNKIVCIVEIKSSMNNKPLNIEIGQIEQYYKFGIPLLFLTKISQIKTAIIAIKNSNWQDELFIKQSDITRAQQNQTKPRKIKFKKKKERAYMRIRGRRASIGITMDPELIAKLDEIRVGETQLPRSTKISMIVEKYIREKEESLQ